MLNVQFDWWLLINLIFIFFQAYQYHYNMGRTLNKKQIDKSVNLQENPSSRTPKVDYVPSYT